MSMNLKELIPHDKFDTESVEKLAGYSFEELEPIVPKLLEWLQDGNWPVSRPLGVFLLTLPSDKLAPYLMEVMQGNDMEWKYFLIAILGSGDQHKMAPEFLKEIQRIASQPTALEIACELDQVAQCALE